jgi:hypothetical protein
MGRTYSTIDDELAQFLKAQHIFFVATAPLAAECHVNLSPKGADTFRILSPAKVAYLDLTGSGIETVAHVRENGRIVLMFCAFEGSPRIVRLHGQGRVVTFGNGEFKQLLSLFPPYPGTRSVILIDVTRVSQSCGFAVPRMQHEADRTQLEEWAAKKGEAGIREYWEKKNQVSIDGIPGLGK